MHFLSQSPSIRLQRHLQPPMLINATLPPPPPIPPVTVRRSAPSLGLQPHQVLQSKALRCSCPCNARRRVRYDDNEDDGLGCEHNHDLAMLESYSALSRSEALLVRAAVGEKEEVVLVFKGFSSCLSSPTAADPSRSVLPAKAVIRSIDVVRGPFDPNNIECLEKGLTVQEFKDRLQASS